MGEAGPGGRQRPAKTRQRKKDGGLPILAYSLVFLMIMNLVGSSGMPVWAAPFIVVWAAVMLLIGIGVSRAALTSWNRGQIKRQDARARAARMRALPPDAKEALHILRLAEALPDVPALHSQIETLRRDARQTFEELSSDPLRAAAEEGVVADELDGLQTQLSELRAGREAGLEVLRKRLWDEP